MFFLRIGFSLPLWTTSTWSFSPETRARETASTNRPLHPTCSAGKLWEGDHYLFGEAYIGRQLDGAWLPGVHSLLPDRNQEWERADSTIRINLARSAVVRARGVGHLAGSDYDSEAD
ncbi:uncharacterized protein M421DRAFT_336696 [Didymella exigua CBS 183.55]|uniref:Uncharacterized protein n=1 Tax=Didymella exigua CBS 183.55 TaxID=1150837 RepID=A0A6A5R693_9PLEO|nr:uncharacterized protein M421DRAFT_336696 [Didymella exigua CBS 183.55]KAF1922909.1 hypothetical protein M421DRAFT_336696 [Didymella exigua CBS 183.55]